MDNGIPVDSCFTYGDPTDRKDDPLTVVLSRFDPAPVEKMAGSGAGPSEPAVTLPMSVVGVLQYG